MYLQVLDTVISTIHDQFEEVALKKFRTVEELLLKAMNKPDSSKKLKVVETNFLGNFDRNQLKSWLHLIPAIFKQSAPFNFCKICKTFQDMDEKNHQ